MLQERNCRVFKVKKQLLDSLKDLIVIIEIKWTQIVSYNNILKYKGLNFKTISARL